MLRIFNIFIISAFLATDSSAWERGRDQLYPTLLPPETPCASGSDRCRCLVTVRTDAGLVQGVRRSDDGYYSFLNVAYAKQPLGELRFQELQPPEPWTGVADATTEGPICPQRNIFYGNLMTNEKISEACIHANVYVPKEASLDCDSHTFPYKYRDDKPIRHRLDRPGAPKLPIFVFVHGGGFSFGSGDADLHGPENLMKNGVIVVTFNYRLRSFGFLSLNSTKVPGNAGLRDVVTLLKWVKRNAEVFGGNPNDITLGGQSAGAAMTHLLALKPERLFKRAIMMSGAASRSFYSSSPLNSARMALYLTTKLGINSTDPDHIFEQLVNTPVESIEAITNEIQYMNGITDFTPVLESEQKHVREIIKVDPDELVSSGAANIPMIIGFTDNECYSFKHLFEQIGMLNKIKENPILVVPIPLIFQLPPEKLKEVAQEIMTEYFKGELTMDKFIQFCSDSYFIYPAIHAAERAGGRDVYLYRFSYIGGASAVLQNATRSHCRGNCSGAGHVEDLLYLFHPHSHPDYARDDDRYMIKWITSVFTTFMKTGKPSSNQYNTSRHLWQPVTKDQTQFLDISSAPRSAGPTMLQVEGPLRKMKIFFDKLYNLTQKTD